MNYNLLFNKLSRFTNPSINNFNSKHNLQSSLLQLYAEAFIHLVFIIHHFTSGQIFVLFSSGQIFVFFSYFHFSCVVPTSLYLNSLNPLFYLWLDTSPWLAVKFRFVGVIYFFKDFRVVTARYFCKVSITVLT